MKGLRWEVTLRNAPELYYKGRGDTPEEALRDLTATMNQGLREAQAQLDSQQRKLEKLLEHLPEEETSTEKENDH